MENNRNPVAREMDIQLYAVGTTCNCRSKCGQGIFRSEAGGTAMGPEERAKHICYAFRVVRAQNNRTWRQRLRTTLGS